MMILKIKAAEAAGGIETLRILISELGLKDTARVIRGMVVDMSMGEPWRAMGLPEDDKEKFSRSQLGSAVLLERWIRKYAGPEKAREMVSKIVLKASVVFLGMNVPRLRKETLLSLDEAGRASFVSRIQNRFFNADADIEFKGEEALVMTVKRCRFVELLDAIDERGMAEVFCAGDREFFEKHQPEIIFDRTGMISSGCPVCDFRFSFKK